MILLGDCREVMAGLEAESIDAIITDPPYGIGFMGREWDTFAPARIAARDEQRRRKGTERTNHPQWAGKGGTAQGGGIAIQYDESRTGNQRFQAWCEEWAREAWRVLKPGGHLVAFCGPRTEHRMTSGIEDAGFEIRDQLAWLYGSGFPKSLNLEGDWEGWGTALKPAYEIIVHAVKPGDYATIDANLSRLEAGLWSMLSASGAALPSSSSPSELGAGGFDGARWIADAPTSTPGASFAQTGMSPSESAIAMSWNTARSWRRTLAELSALTSTYTTGIASNQTTDLRTLSSSIAALTPASITEALTNPHGSRSPVVSVARYFADVDARLSAIRTLSAPVPAIDSEHIAHPVEGARPAYEPIVLARKPLSGTVAATVLEHGTGALNIGASRVGYTVETWPASRSFTSGISSGYTEGKEKGPTQSTGTPPPGRWPANVLLDPEAGAMLDAQAPDAGAGGQATGPTRTGRSESHSRNAFGGVDDAAPFYADHGGASRFFYCAKTSRAEREAGLDGLPRRRRTDSETRADEAAGSNNPRLRTSARRNHHPTVKPVALMRWLVRLLTPPGGTVLDPFTGSGTTGMACAIEGFDFLGIEMEPEYLEIAERRIAWAAAEPSAFDIATLAADEGPLQASMF